MGASPPRDCDLIRIEPRKHARMSDELSLVRIRKRRLVLYRNRGAIYSWLRAHHARVKALLDSGEATWPRLCAEMERHGVVDRLGATPTPNPAIKVWRRVCNEVDDAPVRKTRTYPSRMPKDWKPVELRPQPSGPGTGRSLTPGIHSPGTSLIRTPAANNGVAVGKRDVKAEIEQLRRELAGRRGG
jgi:hypothetical protein